MKKAFRIVLAVMLCTLMMSQTIEIFAVSDDFLGSSAGSDLEEGKIIK